MSARAHAVFQQYLESPLSAAAKPWQIELLRDFRFPGTPTVETYVRLQAALDTTRDERQLVADAAK